MGREDGSFRAQLSAAPLKRLMVGLVVPVVFVLPRSIERGPVEANKERMGLFRLPAFRAQLSAAPLKQGKRGQVNLPILPSALN